MAIGCRISVSLCESKINDVNLSKKKMMEDQKKNEIQTGQSTRDKKKSDLTTAITWVAFRPRPMRKLSGLMSLCKNPFECTYSILVIWNSIKSNNTIIAQNNLAANMWSSCVSIQMMDEHMEQRTTQAISRKRVD